MPAVLDKPRIQCRYRDDQDRQCPWTPWKTRNTASSTCPRSNGNHKHIVRETQPRTPPSRR